MPQSSGIPSNTPTTTPITGAVASNRSEQDKTHTMNRIIEDFEDLSSGIGMLRNYSITHQPQDLTNGKNRINNAIVSLLGPNRNPKVSTSQTAGQGYLGILVGDLGENSKELPALEAVRTRLATLGTGGVDVEKIKQLVRADFYKEIEGKSDTEVQNKLIDQLGGTDAEKTALQQKTVSQLKELLEERINSDLKTEIKSRTKGDGEVEFWGDKKQQLIDQLATQMERTGLDDLEREFGGDKGILNAFANILPENKSKIQNVSPFLLSDANRTAINDCFTKINELLESIDNKPQLNFGTSSEEDRETLKQLVTQLIGPTNRYFEGLLGVPDAHVLPKNTRYSLESIRELLEEWRVTPKSTEQMRYDLCAPNGILSGLMRLPGIDRGHIDWLFKYNHSLPMGPNPPPIPPNPTFVDRLFF